MGCLICKNPENVYYQPKEDSIVTILRRHENLIRKLDDTRLQLEEAKETISNLQREPCRNPTTIRPNPNFNHKPSLRFGEGSGLYTTFRANL